MIQWQTLAFDQTWPAGLALATGALLACLWFLRRRAVFPDLGLVVHTRRLGGLGDRLVPVAGGILLLMLIVVMMGPSVVHSEAVEQRARDFVILVDTSRSMRHDTAVRRADYDLTYTRRVGAFSEAVDDPNALPFVARFELARESLLRFLQGRRGGDRVALMYFNDDAHPVSALTGNVAFVIDQLATMDDYVNWGTDIAAAMDSSLGLLERYPGDNRRALILMTDAETRYTSELEQQLVRAADAGLSFYLLWITTDTGTLATEDAGNFLELARAVGKVITIENLDPANLQEALLDISRLESYSYEEVRHRTIDLGQPLMQAVRILILPWLLLVATMFHPAIHRRLFERQAT